MKSLLPFLLSIVLVSFIATSCCEDVELPYYDFQSVQFNYDPGFEVAANENFVLYFYDFDRTFLAQKNHHFSLIPKAYATQPCPTNGEFGRKYSVTDISITTLQDYDATHLAGSNIDDLVSVRYYNLPTYDYDTAFLAQIVDTNTLNGTYSLQFGIRPTSTDSIRFVLAITKENQEVILDTTEFITWLP